MAAVQKQNSESKESDNNDASPQQQIVDINSILPKCLQNTNNRKCDLSEDLKLINPDIHELFNKYNKLYFDGEISFCEVRWIETKDDKDKDKDKDNNSNNKPNTKDNKNGKKQSKKKKYAGKCLTDSSGFCCIELEKTLLQFKSSKYLIETIIHQMIHSYILTKNGIKSLKVNRKQETVGHSQQFKLIMQKINKISTPFIKLTLNNKQCKQNDDYPSEIIPDQLYLGNIHHALNYDTLSSLKITHVVNCTQSIENKFESKGVGYCRVPVNDKTSESILHYFVKAIRFIESVRNENFGKNNNRILIHCHAGISRSSTITIAYLMYSWKLTMFDAITHVQSKRYIIQPNQGFKNQLLDFYLYLENNEGNLDDFEKKNKPKSPKQNGSSSSSHSNGTNGNKSNGHQSNNNGHNGHHMKGNNGNYKNNVDDNIPCLPIGSIMNGAMNGNNKPNQVQQHNNPKPKVNGNNTDKTKEYVACPVCDKFFTKKYINKHLDECVSF